MKCGERRDRITHTLFDKILHRRIKCSHRTAHCGCLRQDIKRITGMKCRDRQNRALKRIDIAGNNALQHRHQLRTD